MRLLQKDRAAPSGEDQATYENIDAKFVDVPGHFNFRKTVQVEATGAKAIVVVMDAADKKRFSEAAEILYDILGDIEVVSEEIPILVACNK